MFVCVFFYIELFLVCDVFAIVPIHNWYSHWEPDFEVDAETHSLSMWTLCESFQRQIDESVQLGNPYTTISRSYLESLDYNLNHAGFRL